MFSFFLPLAASHCLSNNTTGSHHVIPHKPCAQPTEKWKITCCNMKEYASDQSRIFWSKVSYSGHQILVTDDSYSGWLLASLIFKYLTPATVTGSQPLYETQLLYTSHGYGTSQSLYEISTTERDFEHYICDRSLAYSVIHASNFWRLAIVVLISSSWYIKLSPYWDLLYLLLIEIEL